MFLFFTGKPQSIESSERVQLSGTYNVRKGKLQLPVNRWTRRQVILCGTCLIVSSVKESQIGKMHILPLIGGKVEEVKKHNHCLAFSSAGPQSQTYYVSFDSFTEHLRWHRHAAKVRSVRGLEEERGTKVGVSSALHKCQVHSVSVHVQLTRTAIPLSDSQVDIKPADKFAGK
ncbi:PH domain leucine-rich repeat-containing protein phosphatase 1 [Goodea atripinnis]|uniref:PH domain leucine-rich repeat-containing protein phosphatase 1 n=1 Tax=Goodea atripinnis TaxID=208336 RepID=A0ABV0N3C6_9TELE